MSKIISKIEEGIAYLGINRPEALNALSREIVDEIDVVIDQLKQKKDIRVLIVYSENNFAAGADIKGMIDCNEEEAKSFSFSPTFNKIVELPFPTIAAIEGYALGGGLELALTCDFRIAAEDAKMGFPEINLGIMPGAGGTIRTAKLIGQARAKELILTGEIIECDMAVEFGLINKAVAKEQVLDAAQNMAKKLAKKAPIALMTAKETIRKGSELANELEGIKLEAESWVSLFNTEDQKEGMKAFIEKRKPIYSGK